jgi:hypothetical protein
MEVQDIRTTWNDAVQPLPRDAATQAFIGGANYRISVFGVLKATWQAVKLYVHGKIALATGAVTPVELLELVNGVREVVVSTLDAVRESLNELTYTACLVLAGAGDQGLTEVELKDELIRFLAGADAKSFPWYLGLTESFLTEARNGLAAPTGFGAALEDIRAKRFAIEQGGRLVFKDCHFTWGLSLS